MLEVLGLEVLGQHSVHQYIKTCLPRQPFHTKTMSENVLQKCDTSRCSGLWHADVSRPYNLCYDVYQILHEAPARLAELSHVAGSSKLLMISAHNELHTCSCVSLATMRKTRASCGEQARTLANSHLWSTRQRINREFNGVRLFV